MGSWTERSPGFVGARYDRLASTYGAFEWLHALPVVGMRKKTIDALRLEPGDSVLELGCGDGRNFALIQDRIGSVGAIFGVDMSSRLLSRADRLVQRKGWSNVELTCGDAASFTPPKPIQAALFSFSYCTMRDRFSILRRIWDLLPVGGRMVIGDTFLNPGLARRLFMSMSIWVSERTLLGKPDIDPRADLASIAGEIDQRRIRMYPYLAQFVICAATKTSAAQLQP